MSRFQILRIGLFDYGRGETTLSDSEAPVMPKEEYLSAIFSVERKFRYGNFNYTFIPSFADHNPVRDGFIFGTLGRDEKRNFIGPSKRRFKSEEVEYGNICTVAINIKDAVSGGEASDFGQTITFETDQFSVNFEKLLASILRQANKQLRNEDGTTHWTNVWRPELTYFANQISFRNFLDSNIQDIRRLDFVFKEPNAGDLSDDLKDFLKELQKSSRSDAIELNIMNSSSGFDLSSGHLNELIDYATRGGGEIIARAAKRRAMFRTGDKEHRLSFEDQPTVEGEMNEIGAETFRASIMNNIQRSQKG